MISEHKGTVRKNNRHTRDGSLGCVVLGGSNNDETDFMYFTCNSPMFFVYRM